MTANRIKSGLTAGFAASAVLAIVMILKDRAGLFLEVNPIQQLVSVADNLTGLRFPANLGLAIHFLIGTFLWGLLYAWASPWLKRSPLVNGLLFGIAAFLFTIIFISPMSGRGLFNLESGPLALLGMLLFYLIYGGVLGMVYANINSPAAYDNVRPA
jgi:hypothetical protein